MRILHLVHRSAPFHGGAERYVLEHARAGLRFGHTCVIATTDAWDMSAFTCRSGRRVEGRRETRDGVEIIRFPVVNPPVQDLLRAVLRRLRSGGPDLHFYPNPFVPSMERWLARDHGFGFVHANAMPFVLRLGYRHARRFRAGLASVPHANVGEKHRRVDAIRYFDGTQPEVLRRSSFVVAQSLFERDLFLDMGVAPERVLVLGSGIDPAEFAEADPARGRHALGVENRMVLSLTAHCLDRGSGHLIEACRELWAGGADFTLVLAGPLLGDMRPVLDDALRALPPGRLVSTGYVRQEDRADIIAACDVFVLPSRLDCFGIGLLEAWACGRPVVGCWSGAMPELIREGANGWLAPFGDARTLAHRIGLLLKDPDAASAMGEEGRRQVLSERTWEAVTGRFYERLAECAPREGR
ncbi:glycosyltransferase family 4 protein [Candidatus Fermentibacteria bacterium]|nr:glycosyltransferase family 4 protein [Candidatus Fermentibacteria bacterium]